MYERVLWAGTSFRVGLNFATTLGFGQSEAAERGNSESHWQRRPKMSAITVCNYYCNYKTSTSMV